MPFSVQNYSFGFSTSRPFNSIFQITDLNRDGRPDILFFPNDFGAEKTQVFPIAALLNNGVGGFSLAPSDYFGLATAASATQALVADFDRDGLADIYVSNIGWDFGGDWPGSPNTLLLGRAAGGYVNGTARLPQLSDFTESAAAADIDGDGDLDILAMNIFGGTPASGPLTDPYFLINDGSGQFSRSDDRLPAGISSRVEEQKYTAVAFVDANGDGRPDLFLGSHGAAGQTSRLILNDGGGRFVSGAQFSIPNAVQGVQSSVNDILVADINRDGRPDLVLSVSVQFGASGRIQILMNEGGGQFSDQTAATLAEPVTLSPPESIQFADVNGDSILDLVVRRGTLNPVHLGDGHGAFVRLPQTFLGVDDPNQRVGAADFNGDGRTDFVVETHLASIRLSTPAAAIQNGTPQADALLGEAGADSLAGEAGDDVLFGGEGNDSLTGGDGQDRLVGGRGADTVMGGGGNDTLTDVAGSNYIRGEAGNDVLQGGDDFDDIHGNMGNDTVSGGGGRDWVVGGQDNDWLFGEDGDDIVYGNLGSDTNDGGNGDDWVRGGQANDSLSGGPGQDLIWGDRGDDTISGGAGADTFNIFGEAGLDLVTDFNAADVDRVRVEPGYTHTVAQVGADVVISLSGGAQMTLLGIQLSNLPTGWIIAG